MATSETDEIYSLNAPVAIEPKFGYVVRGKVGVLDRSLWYSEYVRTRSDRIYFSGVPSLWSIVRRPRQGVVRQHPISVLHPYAHNYYHAMIDCVGAIALLAEAGSLTDDCTLVVTEGLASSAVFRHIVDAGALGVPVHVQDGRWITASDELTFARARNTPESLRRTARFLSATVPTASRSLDDRIYVTRDSGHGRTLRNESELRSSLVDLGFRILDPSCLSWPQQVQVFRDASCVVGVHGAGLTNVIFRSPNWMNLLEIQPPTDSDNMHLFRDIALMLDHGYRSVRGTDPSDHGKRPVFSVDVEQVVEILRNADRRWV